MNQRCTMFFHHPPMLYGHFSDAIEELKETVESIYKFDGCHLHPTVLQYIAEKETEKKNKKKRALYL